MDMPDESTLSVDLIHPHGLQVRNNCQEARLIILIPLSLSYIIMHPPSVSVIPSQFHCSCSRQLMTDLASLDLDSFEYTERTWGLCHSRNLRWRGDRYLSGPDSIDARVGGNNASSLHVHLPAEGDVIVANDRKSGSSGSSRTGSEAKASRQALALGLGSMFNHMRIPNVGWVRDIPRQTIRYYTLRVVKEGEELCISYGPKLWFVDADAPEEGDICEDEDHVLSLDTDVFQ
jgi:hypothetical protein